MAARNSIKWAVIDLEPGLPDWTSEEMTISYQGFALTLRPETEDRLATIVIPFSAPRTFQEAVKAGNRFLSAFAWLHEGQGRVQDNGASGSGGSPLWIGKSAWHQKTRPNFGGKLRLDHLQEPPSSDSRAWRALALYREARYLNSVPYEFLGYFKILNIVVDTGPEQRAWITKALPNIKHHIGHKRLVELQGSEPDVPRYLYESGRCAVAHAYADPVVDPDDPHDLLRLRQDLPLARALAEHAVEHALGVKSRRTSYREHLYHLPGFRELFGPELVARLKTEDSVSPADLPALPLICLRFRDEPVFSAFELLTTADVRVNKGRIVLRLRSVDGLAEAILGLDFRSELLEFDFQHGIRVGEDGSVAAVEKRLDRIRMLDCCLKNGQLEIWNGVTNTLLGRSDAILPVNIDSGRTTASLHEEAAALRVELKRRRGRATT
jgi:hypothetical protein